MNSELKKIEDILSQDWTVSDEPGARPFIFPDGKFVHIPKWNKAHTDVDYYLKEKGVIPKDYENVSGCSYLEDLGVIRANLDREGFICLSKIPPTSAQYEALTRFLDEFKDGCMYRFNSKFYLFEPHPKFVAHGFEHPWSLNTDDIIETIKRYYITGQILEGKE